MTSTPQWHASGDWFDVCNCNVPCPCTFAQAPTNNHCEGVLVWHIREGSFGEVPLDGLNVVSLGAFDGNIWAGAKATMGIFLDERADERQREAIQTIFSGRVGGWPAQFAEKLGEMRGFALAPIAVEVAGDLASWRVEIPGKVRAAAEALTGPTTPPGQRVQTLNPPGAEVGPGQVATWGQGNVEQGDAFGFQIRSVGGSSKHFPFDWSGPG